jgi:hypothetical protein
LSGSRSPASCCRAIRLLAAFVLSAATARPGCADDILLTAGPVEVRVSPLGVESVLLRDRHVVGDPRPVIGRAIRPVILTEGWKTLAQPTPESGRQMLVQSVAHDAATVLIGGTLNAEGGGSWNWQMAVDLDGARLRIIYDLQRLEPPARPVLSNRLQIVLPAAQILGPDRRPEHAHDPGVDMTVRLRDGQTVDRPFGAQPNLFRQPAGFGLPFDDAIVPITLEGDVEQLEFWQGGWLQCANLSLPNVERLSACVTFDLRPIGGRAAAVRAETIPDLPRPWLEGPLAPREKPAEVLTLIQDVDAWRNPPREEKERDCTELAKHFDIAELFVAYQDWRYANPAGVDRREALVRQIQEWIDAGHKVGLRMALSLSWDAPLSSERDSSMPEEFRGEVFDPQTGEFRRTERAFDWGNPAAREAAFAALNDIAGRLRDVDYLFFNEPHFNVSTWYEAPFFSQAALDDFRRFVGDETARFPAKPYAPDSPRTNNQATQEDWGRWHDWINHLYAERIRGEARAVAEANQSNPRYGGAIWFQASSWYGDQYGIDLDLVCAIPELAYIVCEYAASASDPNYRAFRYYADRHGKRFGTFVNIGRYDATKPGSTRYEDTPEDTRRTIRFGVDENADLISAYPMWSFYPWNPAHNPERVRVWDEETAALRNREPQ